MKKQTIFYGWWVVLSCSVITLWSGAIFFGITAFVKPIADELHFSYLAISLAASIRSAEMGFLAPVAGFLTDRLGPRRVTLLSGLIVGAGLVLLSQTNSLALFYAAFIIMSIGLSGLGQAVITTAIANWFRKKMGLATGFAVGGYGAGGVFLPLIAWLITNYGWRMSVMVLGIVTWIVILPSSVFLRHKPEQYGYLADGEPLVASDAAKDDTTKPHQTETDSTVSHALKTKVFWLLTLLFGVHLTLVQAVTLHIMPYGASVQLSEETSALIAMLILLFSVAGRLSGGWLGDRFGMANMLAASFFLQFVGMVFLSFSQQLWQFALFLVFYGPAFGGGTVLRPAIIRERFGRSAFGTIQGAAMGVMNIGGLIGPAFAGWVYDVNGAYQPAWLAFAALALGAAGVSLLLRRNSDSGSRR